MRRYGEARGAIINFGSISRHLGLSGLLLYEIAKSGIEGMTRTLALFAASDDGRMCSGHGYWTGAGWA